MVGKEELVELRIVLDMVGTIEDKLKDVMIGYKLDWRTMVCLAQEELIKFVRFANVPHDQMHSVKNIVLVGRSRKYPQRVDKLDRVMNGKLDRYLNMHQYRKQTVEMHQVNRENHHCNKYDKKEKKR